MTNPLTPPPMTEAQFRECGIITGPNLVGNCGPRYRSHGTQTNVWEKDLHALVAARDAQWQARAAELEQSLRTQHALLERALEVLGSARKVACMGGAGTRDEMAAIDTTLADLTAHLEPK